MIFRALGSSMGASRRDSIDWGQRYFWTFPFGLSVVGICKHAEAVLRSACHLVDTIVHSQRIPRLFACLPAHGLSIESPLSTSSQPTLVLNIKPSVASPSSLTSQSLVLALLLFFSVPDQSLPSPNASALALFLFSSAFFSALAPRRSRTASVCCQRFPRECLLSASRVRYLHFPVWASLPSRYAPPSPTQFTMQPLQNWWPQPSHCVWQLLFRGLMVALQSGQVL